MRITSIEFLLLKLKSSIGRPKKWHHFCVCLKFVDFQNSFTVRIRRKFAITLSLKIPPHLNCVATLPCEMRFIDRAIGQWRRRLECVFQQQGGHIEHLM